MEKFREIMLETAKVYINKDTVDDPKSMLSLKTVEDLMWDLISEENESNLSRNCDNEIN